jgi:hypothetical protein
MHLIVIIALGIFGGLWLFTRWAEWREARLLRKYLNPKPPKPVLRSFDEKADRAVNWAIYGGGAAVVVFVSVVAMMSGGH